MKSYVALFLTLLLITSCDKDELAFTKPYEHIQGQWQITSDKVEFHDASGALVHELPHDITTNNTPTLDISDFIIHRVKAQVKTYWWAYSLSQQGKKVIIAARDSNWNTRFEITELTDKKMTWQSEATTGSYLDNGVILTVPKVVTVIKFER